MTKANSRDGRGKNPNSRANLVQFRAEKRAESSPTVEAGTVAPEAAGFQPTVQAVDAVSAAREMIQQMAPAAAQVVGRIVTGSLRAPPHVRLAAAGMVLSATGIDGKAKEPVLPADMEGEKLARLFDNFAKLAAYRQAARAAATVEPSHDGIEPPADRG